MSPTREPMLDFEKRGRISIGTIRTSSVLSALNVVEFGNEVLHHIKKHPKVNLLLNFEHVDYLSSAVLTELLRIQKAIQDSEGHLRLCAVSPAIQEVFKITNLDKVFSIHAEAVAPEVRKFERSLEIAAQEAAWGETT